MLFFYIGGFQKLLVHTITSENAYIPILHMRKKKSKNVIVFEYLGFLRPHYKVKRRFGFYPKALFSLDNQRGWGASQCGQKAKRRGGVQMYLDFMQSS